MLRTSNYHHCLGLLQLDKLEELRDARSVDEVEEENAWKELKRAQAVSKGALRLRSTNRFHAGSLQPGCQFCLRCDLRGIALHTGFYARHYVVDKSLSRENVQKRELS